LNSKFQNKNYYSNHLLISNQLQTAVPYSYQIQNNQQSTANNQLTTKMATNHKISQQTYDETLLENQDLFDLTPDNAIAETISQFSQQGIADIHKYLVTSHPESEEGKKEREERGGFIGFLEGLDDFVGEDGSVTLVDDGTNNGNDNDKGDGISKNDKMMETLNGVYNYCNYGNGKGSSTDNSTGTGTGTGTSTDKATGNIYEQSLPYLTLLHSNQSIYTFMSFLGIVPISTDAEQQAEESKPTIEQMEILNKVTQVLISVLTIRRASERDVKGMIKDGFAPVAMERLLMLIDYFASLVNSENSNGTYVKTLKGLVSLSAAVCKNSQRNKVAFARALKNAIAKLPDSGTRTGSRSSIGLLVKGLTIAYQSHKRIVELSESTSTGTGASSGATFTMMVQLMTEYCRLISILCRYDDFRPESKGGGGVGMDSSYGMNVSSSHDHVLEFNRGGVVPVLYDITILALQWKNNVSGSINDDDDAAFGCTEDDIVSLASAAMSATRVLAVNDEIVQALVAVGILKVVKLALEMGVKEVTAIATNDVNQGDESENGNVQDGNEDTKEILDQTKMQRQNLTAGAIGLVRNLSGNDGIKTSLCLGTTSSPASSSLRAILEGMRIYRDNASIQEHGCGALAAMALRKPMNAMRIIQENGAREIVSAMSKFPNNVLIQRQGALAVRNICSRLVKRANEDLDADEDTDNNKENPSSGEVSSTEASGIDSMKKSSASTNGKEKDEINVRDVFLDLGAEVVLRHITGRHQGSVDEAYAALRDLGCEVTMTKFDQATQKFTRKVEMFGEVKSNFRPVYDEGDDDLQEKIDACGL
jgi:hypothetical protein